MVIKLLKLIKLLYSSKIIFKEPEKKENPLDNIMKEFEKMNNSTTNQSTEKVDLEDDLYVDFEEMDEDEDDT